MMKIFLAMYAVASILKFLGNAIGSLFRPRRKAQPTTSISGDWYGICEKCGTKGGLHRFEGKRYCAKCHAWLSAEKKCGVKTTQTHIAEE